MSSSIEILQNDPLFKGIKLVCRNDRLYRDYINPVPLMGEIPDNPGYDLIFLEGSDFVISNRLKAYGPAMVQVAKEAGLTVFITKVINIIRSRSEVIQERSKYSQCLAWYIYTRDVPFRKRSSFGMVFVGDDPTKVKLYGFRILVAGERVVRLEKKSKNALLPMNQRRQNRNYEMARLASLQERLLMQ